MGRWPRPVLLRSRVEAVMGVYPELVGIGFVATVKGHDGRLPTQKQVRAVQAVLNVVASILVLSPIRFRLDATITLDEAEG